MVQAICKNTFISFVADIDDDSLPTSLCASPKLQPRSRSAESTRCRPDAEEFRGLSQQSLHRLNAVLAVGMSSPRLLLGKESTEVGEVKLEEPAMKFGESNGLSELRLLQEKLAKALGSPAMKPFHKHRRVDSNCSLSTMAPDDASECGELPNGSGMKMNRAWSSGSVSTMVSDFNFSEEDGEVEFELDIAVMEPKQRWADVDDEVANKSSGPVCEQTPAVENGTRSKVTSDMSHSSVPRNQNMEELYNSSKDKDEPPTTMMIRNVPGRYTQNDLMMDLQDLGLAGTYDFLYMPMDKGTAANVGYAFVNFNKPLFAEKCVELFTDYRFSRRQCSSNKLANVSVAHLQGLEKNLQHYENAAVNMSKEKRRRPVVVANIAKMFG